MKNVILIDLRMFNYEKLEEVAKLYDLDVKILSENKKNGISKVWIDSVTGLIIAYSTKQFKDNIFTTESFITSLESVRPVEIIKQAKLLTVNEVLDKIGKYGIESLNESEKRFLEDQ